MPTDASNLVWRAAQALWSASGRNGDVRGVHVTVEKRIPSQAGLGGGSSDAAATLMALNELWRTRFDAGDLARLGASLGADVPYFLLGGTALGLGRGETLYPLPDVPSMGVLVVKPSFGVSTADAYRWYAATARQPSQNVQALAVPWYPGPLVIANDLEAAVMRHHPELVAIRRALLQKGAEVALMCWQRIGGLRPVPNGRERARGCGWAHPACSARGHGSADGRPWQVMVTRLIGRAGTGDACCSRDLAVHDRLRAFALSAGLLPASQGII